MDWLDLHNAILAVQHSISLCGILIIVFGVVLAAGQFAWYTISGQLLAQGEKVNRIRLGLGRILILGLEFIVAADLISTTTTPDYYALGMVAIVVAIRTLLSFSINREIMSLSAESAS
jgi:uncharacterized membrane protein